MSAATVVSLADRVPVAQSAQLSRPVVASTARPAFALRTLERAMARALATASIAGLGAVVSPLASAEGVNPGAQSGASAPARAKAPRRGLPVIPTRKAAQAATPAADSGTPCSGGSTKCVISVAGGTGNHGVTGGTPSPNPISHVFDDPNTFSADGNGGAIDFSARGGNGGDANTHGQNGGNGGWGGDIGTVTIGSAVVLNGSHGGGIASFLSQAGNGGGGDGAITGTRGTGGQGGGGGGVRVYADGVISSADAGSPGLVVRSSGGSGGGGNSGGDDFFGAFAGSGGQAGAVAVGITGTISTVATAAQVAATGGSGGPGPGDTGTGGQSIASNGGNGGSAGPLAEVTIAGSVVSSQGAGLDLFSQGGRGGDGGGSSPATVSQGGNGGSGGAGGAATGTISGTAHGATQGLAVRSLGGDGGNGGQSDGSLAGGHSATGGNAGPGGNAGVAQGIVEFGASVVGSTVGATVVSTGGNGGNGGGAAGAAVQGGSGGAGGSAGSADLQVNGAVGGAAQAAAIGAAAIASGGDGGTGSSAGGGSSRGGKGGNGGSAGRASVEIQSNGSVTTLGADTPTLSTTVVPGVLAAANGGLGGAGGSAFAPVGADGGGSGYGGGAGTADVAVDGSVTTQGSFAYGVLAQSAGGTGSAAGAAGSVFLAHGGKAVNGAHGGTAILSGNGGTVTTTGSHAAGLVAQSIGGGGGTGGNALAVAGGLTAIGGNGGAGGDGGAVKVGLIPGDATTSVLQDTVITRGDTAIGILAQSIGGGGGNGGNALAADLLPVALTIGGDGKGGGAGGSVQVANAGLVTTFGVHSEGVVAQSIGGGGGNGGAGIGIDASYVLAVAVSVGGTGASGGSGGSLSLVNSQQVTTYGADSYGLKAQSIAGGGGSGGTTLDLAAAYSNNPELPSISVSVGIGGTGGAGGNQGSSPVSLANSGLVTTSGAGSFGLFAQSIAGGGGNGGDSTASSYAKGKTLDFSVSLGVAGSGGASGTGGAVTIDNSGLVVTYGQDAHGVMAQSIGGGGGVGGVGDAAADTSAADKFGVSGSASVGGKGGHGSLGGLVTVTNVGSVATGADGSRGIFAQSVGGGGGASGGGAAKANAQNLSLSVSVGGNAGSGGDGGEVRVTNSGSVLTQGADADAVFAQSIGGGGGIAGKGSSTAGGGNEPYEVAEAMATTLTNGLNLGKGTAKVADGVFQILDGEWKDVQQLNDLRKLLQGSPGALPGAAAAPDPAPDKKDGEATSIGLDVTIGGVGGAGGQGGKVTVDNSASIETQGSRSNGVFAQSTGGGGGVGGVSSFSTSVDDKGGSLSMGGNGAAAGNGGAVTVTHEAGATITTGGAVAHGIFAQSIGGGGGKGGLTGSEQGALRDLNIVIGGSGAAGGNGGAVGVQASGAIMVTGEQAFGILAQSAGGGGGTADVLTDGKAGSPDKDIALQLNVGGQGGAGGDGGAATVSLGGVQGASVGTHGSDGIGIVAQSIGGGGGIFVTSSILQGHSLGLGGVTIPVAIGGTGGSTGNGGNATVTLGADSRGATSTPYIVTTGRDAYAVLAQSVGGGGGLVAGTADAKADVATLFASTQQKGNGGTVQVSLENSAWIYTSGAGAAGIVAQSIGGGGGLIGGLSKADVTAGLVASPVAEGGQGGNVSVDLESNSNIITLGARAHGIYAQSGGGGAGVLAQADGSGRAFSATSAYTGCGSTCTGSVSVHLASNTLVRSSGSGAYGIVVQSRGNGINDTTIQVDAGAYVESWKDSAGAIFVDGAGTNRIVNAGMIDDGTATDSTNGKSKAGIAITGNQPITVNNYDGGVITGKQILDGSGGTPATAGALSAASAAAPASVGKGTLNNLAGGIVRAGSELRLGGGTLHNAGTLDIGGQGLSQTRLQGDLKQEAGGHLVVDIDTINRQADKLVVDGSAELAGTVHVRAKSLSPHAVTVVQAGGGTTVDPSTAVQDAGGNLLFGYQFGNADGGGVTITPFSKLASSSVATAVGSGRASLAKHLDAGFNDAVSDKQAHVYAQLAALPAMAGVSGALDNLSGEALQSAAITRLIGSMQFSERMNTVRCDAREKMGDAPREADCSWARVVDGRTTRDATADEAGFVLDGTSLQGGFQRRVAPNWFVGGALSYDNSSLRANSIDQRVTGNGGSVGAVLKYESGPWMVSGSADIGYGRYDSTRHIALGDVAETAKASFGMWHAGLHSRVAYLLPLDGYYLRPYVDVHAVRIRTDGYQESGADALNLQVERSSRTYMTVSPMLEFGGVHDLASGMQLRSFAALGAALHGNASGQAEARLQGWGNAVGAPTFTTSASVPKQRAKVELGGTLVLRKNMELSASYGGEFASGFRSHTGQVQYRYLFD